MLSDTDMTKGMFMDLNKKQLRSSFYFKASTPNPLNICHPLCLILYILTKMVQSPKEMSPTPEFSKNLNANPKSSYAPRNLNKWLAHSFQFCKTRKLYILHCNREIQATLHLEVTVHSSVPQQCQLYVAQ